ncbi:TPA: hypothetical protein ACTZ3A_001192 [Bacillus cereus]
MIMIHLNTETKEFLTLYGDKLKVRTDKVIVNGKLTIPSKLYPLNNKRTIAFFCYANTKPLTSNVENYEIIKKVFDEKELMPGYCYQNSEQIREALITEGIPERDIQTYVGWILIGAEVRPIHHCWIVYKNEYLLDGSTLNAELKARQVIIKEKINDVQAQREIVTEFMTQSMKMLNSETRAFGQAFPMYDYVGTQCTPNEGRIIYTKLINVYPNHPSYNEAGQNPLGASKTQEMLYSKLKK